MMAILKVLVVFVAFFFALSGPSNGAKILSISFVSTKSHQIVYKPLLLKLAERGHQVTIVSPLKSDKQVPNVTEIFTLDLDAMRNAKGSKMPNMFEMKESGSIFALIATIFGPFMMMGGFAGDICKASYELPQVQNLMQEKWDLVIFPPFVNDCLYGLVHKLNTSTVLISQSALMPWVAQTFGIPTPPSFVPLGLYAFSDKMSYFQRLGNFLGTIINDLVKTYYYNPKMEKIYREAIDPNLPSIMEIEKNASMCLVNSHISFTKPRPLMPDVVEVGGMHFQKPKPVSKDLDDFLSGSGEDGFIFFSMGSALKSADLPPRHLQMFLNTFSKLKQRVLWKFETEEMEGLPKNVKLAKWLPQLDILGHKNIRMFISHCGHGGTTEALTNGVPLVAIPIAADQPYNAQRAEMLGFAVILDFAEMTEESLTDAINKILHEPQYKEAAKKLQSIQHDQIDDPMDRAVYWTEYVIRHQGAVHLRSAARDLSSFQYYSLDVLGTLAILLAIGAYINYRILRAIWRKCFSKKGGDKKKKE